jgi:PAS domain S-box-containing protein
LLFGLFLGIGLTAAQPAPLRSINVVMYNNYPPFCFMDNIGKLQGILVDEWRLWEKQTGIKVELYAMNWGEALRRMQAGEFDVIDTIFETRERAAYLDFSKPYFRIDVPIFFRKGISGITDLQSLKGFTVAAKAGDASIDLLRQNGINTVLLFTNYQAIIEAARQHQVNVFMADKPPTLYFLHKLGLQDEFRQSAAANRGEFHRAVRKGNTALLKTVEEGFAALDPARLNRIEEKWYGISLGSRPSLRFIGYVAVSGLAIILALGLWSLALKRLVKLRTAALQASESRLRALLDHIPDWVWLKDTNSRYVTANAAYARAVNCPVETLPGRSDAELWPDKDAREFVADDQAVLKSGQAKRVLRDITDAHGNRYCIETLKAPVRNAAGVTIGAVGISRDMTEPKRAEAELRRMNRTLRVLSEGSETVARVTDEAELFQAVCRLLVETGGYRMAWVGLAEQDEARSVRPAAHAGFNAGYTEAARITWGDSQRGEAPTGRAIRTGQPVIARNILTDATFGQWREGALQRGYAASAALPLKHDQEVFGALMVYTAEPDTFDPAEVALLTELTTNIAYGIAALRTRAEHRRAEEALNASEKKYRNIIENAPVGIFQSTPEGRLLNANLASARMFGYDTPADLQAAADDIPRHLFVSGEQRQHIVEAALQSDRFVRGEVEYRRKDGSVFVANLYMRAVRDEGANAALMEGFVEDITERKRAEEHLRQSRERARALSARLQSLREEERTRLAREIHDHLGQLLTALKLDLHGIGRKISGLGEAELRTALTAKVTSAREIADEVIVSVQKIASELRPGVLDRLGLAAAVEAEAQAFEERVGIRCHWRLPKETLALSQDQATAMFRIFQEILTNIARHARATEVTVELSIQDGRLVLEAMDNGVGMRPGDIENPLSLGLLGMQERAAILGGNITFKPGPTGGTTVTASIPLHRKADYNYETNPDCR